MFQEFRKAQNRWPETKYLKNDNQKYQWLEAWAILVISSFIKGKKPISVRSGGRVLNGFDKRTFSQYWTNLHI